MARTIKRVLFFHQGRMSDINGSVYRGLCARFPEAEVRAVDINKRLKARPWIIAINLAVAFFVYGWDLIRGKRDLDESFFGTGYIFRKMKMIAQVVHKKWPADFSFQTWSMFDLSSPGTPHFVYTDHTYRSAMDYPAYGTAIWAPIRREWVLALEETIYENAAAILTWSRNVSTALTERYGIEPEKVFCAGVGTNIPLETLCQCRIEDDRYRSRRVVFVGKTWELKGGPELVAAFRLVRRTHPDATLTIVGCNPDITDTGVHVVGRVPLAEVCEHLAGASVFCMPTRNEPFGIAFLEALAAGLPVVALRQGAAPDFVIPGKTGVLVEEGDIEELSRALVNLLNDPEMCHTFGENGRSLVQQSYAWPRVLEKMGSRILACVVGSGAATPRSGEGCGTSPDVGCLEGQPSRPSETTFEAN